MLLAAILSSHFVFLSFLISFFPCSVAPPQEPGSKKKLKTTRKVKLGGGNRPGAANARTSSATGNSGSTQGKKKKNRNNEGDEGDDADAGEDSFESTDMET